MAARAAEIQAWLARFERCVRERDFAAGRALFAPEVRAFGTRAAAVCGIDALVERQWRPIWNSTSGFELEQGAQVVSFSSDGELAWVASRWRSKGSSPPGDGAMRHGRATLILRADGARWLAVHTHFSEDPVPPG